MLRDLKGERAVWLMVRIVCLSIVSLSGGAAEGGSISLLENAGNLPSPPVSPSFLEAISTRSTVVEDFDRFAAGQHLDAVALSNFFLVIDVSSVSVQAADETTLERSLPSAPIAAAVDSDGTIPWLEWRFDVPVASLDFVFIDLDGGGLFEVTYADGSAPSALSLLATPWSYQWVGLLSDQSDIATVRFVPNQPHSYAFDNVRTSSVPEPAGAIVVLSAMVLMSAFSGRRNHARA